MKDFDQDKISSLLQWPFCVLWLTAAMCAAAPEQGFSQTIACGQTVTNATAAPSEIDQYQFAGVAGEAVSFALLGSYGYPTYGADWMEAEIWSPGGQLIGIVDGGSGGYGHALSLTLTNTGLFVILVHENNYRYTGTYSLSIQSVIGGGCNSRPIACGQTLSAATSFGAQMDAYAYNGVAGQVLSFALLGSYGYPTYGSDWMQADIYNPAGQLVAIVNGGSGAVGHALNLALTNSGTFTILVHENGYRLTDNYSLSIQSVIGGGCNSRPIACGQTLGATTSFGAQMDAYAYNGVAGQVLSFALLGSYGYPTYGSDWMQADIYSPAGQLLGTVDGGSGAIGHALSLALTNSGIFTILVHENNYRYTDNYSLSIQSIIGGGCNSTPIACGQTLSATSSFGNQMDAYAYNGVAGQVLSFALLGSYGYPTYGSDWMQADIYSPGGQLIAIVNGGFGAVGHALNLTLTNSGTFTILVHENNFRLTDNYSLSIQSVIGGGCNSSPIACGQTVSATSSFGAQIDAYAYNGVAGQVLSFALLGSYGYPTYGSDWMQADIYSPAGQLLGTVDGGSGAVGHALNLTLTNTGTFTILVHENGYRLTDNYSLTIQSVTGGGCNSSPFACGQTVGGAIGGPSLIEAYQLAASGGEHILLSTSGFGTMVTDLYDPTGLRLASVTAGNTINLTLPTTGLYTVLVHASNYAGTGSYSISLTVFGGCDRVELGSTVVQTQAVGCIGVELMGTSPTVWISFTIRAPSNQLNNATLTALPQFTTATIVPGADSQWLVTLQTDPANGVPGNTNVASICFNAVATQSAFVPVLLSDLVITNQGGGVPGATGFGGRVVIVADQPLLEASLGTNRQRFLTIYGHPNTDYEIDYSTNLGAPSPWLPGWTNTVPATLSLSGSIPGPLSNAPALLLRAQQR